jgi:hypothetical protein
MLRLLPVVGMLLWLFLVESGKRWRATKSNCSQNAKSEKRVLVAHAKVQPHKCNPISASAFGLLVDSAAACAIHISGNAVDSTWTDTFAARCISFQQHPMITDDQDNFSE